MKQILTLRRISLSGLLIVSIIGLLAIYGNAVNHLPSQIYSEAQLEFLSRNDIRSVYQMAPILNTIDAEGIVKAILLSWKTSHCFQAR